eukprot:5743237-Pyramimonas_sp.AAC.1
MRRRGQEAPGKIFTALLALSEGNTSRLKQLGRTKLPPDELRARAIGTTVPEGPTGPTCHAKRGGGSLFCVKRALAQVGSAVD